MLDRKNKPEPKPEKNFSFPKTNVFFLKNGLRILFIKKDTLPLVRVKLIVNAGSKFDPKNKIGLAYLTSVVLDEGADDLNALQLSDEFDLLGSALSVSTDNDLINLNLQCLTEHFEKSLELLSKVVLKPSFNNEDFLREKKKLITKILQSSDQPDYLASEIFDQVVLGKSNSYAFPISGYEETVNNISVEDSKSYYKKFFSPSNSDLIVVGNLNQNKLEQSLNKYFSQWENIQNNFSLLISSAKPQKKIYLFHKEGTVQTEIRVGHLAEKRNPENYFQRYLLNTILGGQFTSRINLNLRERNGYTYGATSRFQYFKDSAYFEVSTSVGTENTTNALNEILFELENIHNGIHENELKFAKTSITKRLPLSFETFHHLASGILIKIFFDLPDDYYDTYIEKVNAVSKTEVDDAADKFIHNDQVSIVLVGDKNLLLKKLKELKIETAAVNIFGEEI